MKKVLLPTLIAAFLFGCSAEGTFTNPENPIGGDYPHVDWDDVYCITPGSTSCISMPKKSCSDASGVQYSTLQQCQNALNLGGTNPGTGGDVGYCLMSGYCYDMSYYSITSSTCNNTYGGTVYSTQSACEAANNTVSSDGYCLVDNYCYDMSYYSITSSTCSNTYGGTVYSSEASCNANISTTGYGYCYTEYDHDCWQTSQDSCDYYGGTMVGSTSASCPAGSY